MPERAAVYARFSSHRQGEQSIEGQLAAAQKYAKDHDMMIVAQYIDRAKSGKTDNREDFQRMLRDTAKRQFSVIILWKIDRFGRNREEIAFNRHKCKKNGVRIVRIAEDIPDGAEGVILDSVLEGMAEYYSLQLAQNVRRGQRASAEKCQSTGGSRPLGYLTDPKTKKYVIDPETAPTVQLVYREYAAGKTISEIVSLLNKNGLRTSRGRPFGRSSIDAMLKNQKYIGVYSYNGEIRVEGGIPAIIDKGLFDEVQKKLDKNKKAPSKKWSVAEYILTNKLFCGLCGEKMYGESGTSRNGSKYSYYTCSKRKRGHKCRKTPVRQDLIEGAVIDLVLAILSDDELVEQIADAVWKYYEREEAKDDTLKMLKRNLAEVEKAQSNITKAVEAGMFSQSLVTRMAELDAQRADIEAQIATETAAKDIRLTKDFIKAYFYSLRQKDFSDRDAQKELIDTFVNAIFVFDDGTIKVTFNYADGDPSTITLQELQQASDNGELFGYCPECSTKPHTLEHFFVQVFQNVFVVCVQLPQKDAPD